MGRDCNDPADTSGADPVAKLKRDAVATLEQDGRQSDKYRAAAQALGRALFAKAEQLQARGCFVVAAATLQEMIDITAQALGREHPIVVSVQVRRAGLLVELGQLTDAEHEFRSALAAVQARPEPPARQMVAKIENDMALLHQRRNDFQKAKEGFERALAINQAGRTADDVEAAKNLHNLALIQVELGQYDQAEPSYMRALKLIEGKRGSENEEVATILNNIASLYRRQGLYEKAEPFYRRALDIRETRAKAGSASVHPDLAQSYNNLGWLHQNMGERARDRQKSDQALKHFAEAEGQFRRTAAMYSQSLGERHPRVGSVKNNLAVAMYDRANLTGSRPLLQAAAATMQDALDIRRASLGAQHPSVAQSMHRLARIHEALGSLAEAHTLHRQALATREASLDAEHTDIVQNRHDLAQVLAKLQDWREAAKQIELAHNIVVNRSRRGIRGGEFGADERGRQEIAGMRSVFHRYAGTLWQLAARKMVTHDSVRDIAFGAAQRAGQSAAEAALLQMSARQAKGTGELAELVRRRQDIVRQWQALDERLNTSIASDAARRKVAEEENIERQKRALDLERVALDARLQQAFPDFAQFTHPHPVSMDEVQRLLHPEEALVLFLTTKEETLVWVVTPTDKRWVRIELSAAAMAREVKALRCGLDERAWDDTTCYELLGMAKPEVGTVPDTLPFDHIRAHALYTALFQRLHSLIRGRHLLIVSSGPLTELPLQVLVSRPPASKDHGKIHWLVRDHPISVLPAVSSLRALRRVAHPSAASKPMIGFGNPWLDGDRDHQEFGRYFAQQAALARSHTSCAAMGGEGSIARRRASRGVDAVPQTSGLADLTHLRMLSPLPETADELCSVARALGADLDEVFLGDRAIEREIKVLSASGKLAQFRVMHFATHGLLAGRLVGTSEPGLILTPPAAASTDDDGFLSASEIAGLKLDADWVVLSACNTAGGAESGDGGEALSGLARSFFYAQARALLVSHWEVNSDAAVKLVTRAIGSTTGTIKNGRAEALRRAMLTLIESPSAPEAHPSYWAPFVVVGEGGVGR